MFNTSGLILRIGAIWKLRYASIQEIQIEIFDTKEILTFIYVDQYCEFHHLDKINFSFSPRSLQTQKYDNILYYALQIHSARQIEQKTDLTNKQLSLL